MSLRFFRRAVALVLVLGGIVLRYWKLRVRGPLSLERRAQWLQDACVRILRSMEIRCQVEGEIPRHGLVVANHLSYLDIVIVSAAMPCFFVAKSEIDSWPYFGKAARAGGTMFIDRSRRASAEKVAAMISERLTLPVPVLFFPEGTSTNGTMLRFHSRLFEPAIRDGAPVTAAAISYFMADGAPESELCWFGDGALAPHFVKTLKAAGFHAKLQFGEPRRYAHRRIAADETFDEIAAMRAGTIQNEQSESLQPV
jgi:1-acyl-sn-glycerol-3-phosphate acyltransferase